MQDLPFLVLAVLILISLLTIYYGVRYLWKLTSSDK